MGRHDDKSGRVPAAAYHSVGLDSSAAATGASPSPSAAAPAHLSRSTLTLAIIISITVGLILIVAHVNSNTTTACVTMAPAMLPEPSATAAAAGESAAVARLRLALDKAMDRLKRYEAEGGQSEAAATAPATAGDGQSETAATATAADAEEVTPPPPPPPKDADPLPDVPAAPPARSRPTGLNLTQIEHLRPDSPASEYPELSLEDEEWLLDRWRNEWCDKSDDEGCLWLYHPPHPFQRFSIVPERVTAVARRELAFVIQSRDIFHRPVNGGTDLWTVTVEGQDDGTRLVRWRIFPQNQGNGTYLVRSPVPAVPGEYHIRIALSFVNMTQEQCDFNMLPGFCRWMRDCPPNYYGPDWANYNREVIANRSTRLVSSRDEKRLLTRLTILAEPEGPESDDQSHIALSADGGWSPRPADVPVPSAPVIPRFTSKRVCADTRDRPGYNIGAWFLPWHCHLRYDRAFHDRCVGRTLAGKSVLVLGNSLEQNMNGVVHGSVNQSYQTRLESAVQIRVLAPNRAFHFSHPFLSVHLRATCVICFSVDLCYL